MENKRKHLEFIQNIITRMNMNSFMIKGWAVTLVAALFALAAKDSNRMYVLIVYLPIPLFWIMDGFYLSKERQFCDKYKEVAAVDENAVNFLMDIKKFDIGRNTWINVIFSSTLSPFYVSLFVISLIVMFLVS